MKTILLPTHFSPNDYTALLYAADLAECQGARLILLHVFHKKTFWFESPAEIRQKENAFRTESLRQLEALENSPALAGKRLKITTEIRNGKVVEEILKLVRELNVDLVVMGNQSAHLPETVFGHTLTTEVVEKTSCPVLVIPRGLAHHPIRHIVSAVDHHDSDLLHTIELTKLARLFKAGITLLHIAGHSTYEALHALSLEQLKAKVSIYTHYYPIRTQLMEGENVISQISQYTEENATDLLAMASKKRSVLERVSGFSLTKQMIFCTNIPLLIYRAFDLHVLE